MANCINLIAFGTFGNPNGFKQTFFVGSNDLAKSVKTFDLNTNAIKLFSKSKIYSIRKESVNGFNTIAYSIYTYAKEQNSDRLGTFIGSSILFTKKIAKEHITVSQLNEFHKQLVNKNVSNNIISVNHSDAFSVIKPKDFDKIEFNLSEVENINFKLNTHNCLVVFCSVSDSNLANVFEKSLDLLNIYDTIYFTDSKEVAEFVLQKGVFKLIQNVGDKKDFDKEINDLKEDRKRKREQSISEFEREVQRINDAKKQTIQEFKFQLEQSEKTHLENERKLKESKGDINKIELFHDEFLNKTKNLIQQLKHHNGKLDEVKQIHNSNKILFNNAISDLKKPIYTTSISKPKPKGKLNIEQPIQYSNIQQDKTKFGINAEFKKNKIDFFKVTTLILGVLLISTWVYLFLAGSENSEYTDEENLNNPKSHQFIEPNSKLSKKDYKIVASKINYEYKIDTIVDIIFKLNPNDIQSTYKKYREKYSSLLYKENENCFKIVDKDTVFKKDSIKYIPSFKK